MPFAKGHTINIGRPSTKKIPLEIRICQCGCNENFECRINSNKRLILNHKYKKLNSGRWINRENRICACGCQKTFEVRPKDNQKWINGHWMKGRKRTKEVKAKLSEQKKGEKNPMYREGHWNWKGGVSFVPYPLGWSRTFKEQIRYRDGYRCQDCGIPESELGQRLDVHHIDENKFNLEITNLVCLCRSCHTVRHHNKKAIVV